MLLATLLVCFQAAAGDQDVVVLRSGGTRTGRIVSETPTELIVETFIKSAKGQVVGSARLTIPRADIERIERASPESRRQADERSKAFSERGIRRAELLAKFTPAPIRLNGRPGFEVRGTQFILHSTCDLVMVKDIAVCLEEVFAAYRRFFEVQRNLDRKVKITVLNDRTEYDLHNMAWNGGTIPNVAFYNVPDNSITAYNLIEREKEREIRRELQDAQKDIERFRSEVQSVERQIVGLVKDLRQKIHDEAVELRRRIRADGQGAKDARVLEIDRLEKQALDELKEGKAAAQKELQDARRKAAEAAERCARVIDRNEKVIVSQNGELFETLFHEGFHAFAANFLWEGSGQKEFPRWLHEGMAGYFERSVVESGLLIHGSPHPAFLGLMKDRFLAQSALPTEKLLRSGAESFMLTHAREAGRQTAYYAQSWALAHYLAGRVTPKQIETYVNEVISGKDGVESFERMLGKKCGQVDAELRAHLETIK